MAVDRQTKATLAALMTLKRQFEAGASQYHRLNHLLAEAPRDQPDWLGGPFPVEGCRQPNQALGTSYPSTEISFRVQGGTEPQESRIGTLAGPRVFQFHAIYVSGSFVTEPEKRTYSVGRDQFVRLAERAGECLLSLPPDVINIYPQEWNEYERYLKPQRFTKLEPSGEPGNPRIQTVERTYDAILPIGSKLSDRWCGFLHWLAWRGEDGAILKARRQTWSGFTTLPWTPTLNDYIKLMSILPPLANFPFETTRHFFSVLEDVFLCSALAIDMIEATLSRHHPETTPAATASPKMVHDAANPLRMMFCYSHANKRQRKRVETHLALMKREKLIDVWYDRKITAGLEWHVHIDDHINSADIILLFLSAAFIESHYCFDIEMKRALERHAVSEARVIPIILQKCDWKNTPLKDLQALPTDGLPVDQWNRTNDAYHDIANGIRKVVEELNTSRE